MPGNLHEDAASDSRVAVNLAGLGLAAMPRSLATNIAQDCGTG
jgi:hypothetical protein